jgi:putative nucleotidyltransferase with HDIG domain
MGLAPQTTEPEAEQRWRPRRVAAGILRLLILVVPIAVGFAVGATVSLVLPEPTNVYEVVLWWIAVIAAATVTSTAVDRVARSFLPLTILLRMTMLFPDAAPPRFRTARKAGNVKELRRRIIAAGDDPETTDLAEMAELVLALSTALSNHDRKTRGHSERTRAYTDMLAEEMGLPEPDRDRLRWAALLHDVGKLEVPTEILNKDSSLDPEEWELIRQHPVNGMRLVAPLVPWLGEWAKTIEHHHERYDGTGYPHGLSGEEICLGARIVTVADAFDVMTSGRSYQTAMSPAAARREIVDQAGVQFDPDAARALMTVSLGRLRWSAGPLAALAQIPIFRGGLPQVGRDLAMVLTTSAVMTTGFITGALPAPEGITISAAQIIEVVTADWRSARTMPMRRVLAA